MYFKEPNNTKTIGSAKMLSSFCEDVFPSGREMGESFI